MTPYKCPACGRSHISLPMVTPSDPDAGVTELPPPGTEVHCKDCGWFGPVEDLKTGH